MFNPDNNWYMYRCAACYRSFPSLEALHEHRENARMGSLARALLNMIDCPPQQPNQSNARPPALPTPSPRNCNNAELVLPNVPADPSVLSLVTSCATSVAAVGMQNCRNHPHRQLQPPPKEDARRYHPCERRPSQIAPHRYHPYEKPPAPIAETTNWRRTRDLLCFFVGAGSDWRGPNPEQQASPERTVTDPIVREEEESGDEGTSGTKKEELDLDLKLGPSK